MPFKTATTTPI